MTKNYQFLFFLDNIRYFLTKIDIILFLTLSFNKKTIAKTINMF